MNFLEEYIKEDIEAFVIVFKYSRICSAALTTFQSSPPARVQVYTQCALVPDGRIQGRWTQKWPSKISCGLGSQRPRKRPNSKFPNCGLILTIIGKNWPKNLKQKIFTALFLMIWGVAGLRPNFFLQRPNFLAELAQESWRDLAAVTVCGRG